MLPGDDVLDMVREFAMLLEKLAVLATVAGSTPDRGARCGIHR
jgi:hypothetical protein